MCKYKFSIDVRLTISIISFGIKTTKTEVLREIVFMIVYICEDKELVSIRKKL